MKNIILASVAAAALANVAAAESASVQWTGTVSDMPDECVFVANENGTMNYDDSVRTFFVDTPAFIKVQQRGGSILNIESSSYVERVGADSATGHNSYDVEVNYMVGTKPSTILKSAGAAEDKVDITASSDVVAAKGGWGPDGGATLEVADGVWKGLDIELGGKAKLLFVDHLIENGDYAIQHTATCIQ